MSVKFSQTNDAIHIFIICINIKLFINYLICDINKIDLHVKYFPEHLSLT